MFGPEILDRRAFLVASSSLAVATAHAAEPVAPNKARIAITLDLEMSRH